MRAFVLFSGTLLLGSAAHAAETTTFTYDALGRLTQSSNSGGPRNGSSDSTSYDPAGNRQASAIGSGLPPPTNNAVFSIVGPSPVNEGSPAVFTINKTGTASSTLSVNYATANGTASAPGDYTAKGGTLSFPAFATSQTVSVPTIDDGIGEGAEGFTMSLSNPTTPGSSIGTGTATATINASVPANQPPTTTYDTVSGAICTAGPTKDVLANDTDPEGNLPLALTAVESLDPAMDVNIVPGSTTTVRARNSAGVLGSMDARYTVADSLGATSYGTLTVTWNDTGACN